MYSLLIRAKYLTLLKNIQKSQEIYVQVLILLWIWLSGFRQPPNFSVPCIAHL